MASALALAMAGAASAHQAATASREQNSQQRAGRTRRTSADLQRAPQGTTAAAVDAPAALDSLSRLQRLADASPQVAQLRRLQALADGQFAPVAQLAGGPEEEELVQGKFSTAELQPQLQQAPRANNTGLPDQLKSSIESLSGLSMDHVRVHYNSAHPAQLNALAYAQGSDIHLAPGQERHLPHEAWHVVQQAQGRVRPTLQMKDGMQVNDDQGLEREAEVMGGRADAGLVQLVGDGKRQDLTSTFANSVGQMNSRNKRGFEFVDNRQEAIAQKKLQGMANISPQAMQLRAFQEMANNSPQVKQLRAASEMVANRPEESLLKTRQTHANGISPIQLMTKSECQQVIAWRAEKGLSISDYCYNPSTNLVVYYTQIGTDLRRVEIHVHLDPGKHGRVQAANMRWKDEKPPGIGLIGTGWGDKIVGECIEYWMPDPSRLDVNQGAVL